MAENSIFGISARWMKCCCWSKCFTNWFAPNTLGASINDALLVVWCFFTCAQNTSVKGASGLKARLDYCEDLARTVLRMDRKIQIFTTYCQIFTNPFTFLKSFTKGRWLKINSLWIQLETLFNKIILCINSYILRMPLKIDEISRFYLKLLSVKKRSGDLVIFFWPSQNIGT